MSPKRKLEEGSGRVKEEGQAKSPPSKRQQLSPWLRDLTSLESKDWVAISSLTPLLAAHRRSSEPYAKAVQRLWPCEDEQRHHIGRWVFEVLQARSLEVPATDELKEALQREPKPKGRAGLPTALVVSRFLPEARALVAAATGTRCDVIVSAVLKRHPQKQALFQKVDMELKSATQQAATATDQLKMNFMRHARRFYVLSRRWLYARQGQPESRFGVRVLTATEGPLSACTVVEMPNGTVQQLFLTIGDATNNALNRQVAWGIRETQLNDQDPHFCATLDAMENDWTAANYVTALTKRPIVKQVSPFFKLPQDLVRLMLTFLSVDMPSKLVRRELPACHADRINWQHSLNVVPRHQHDAWERICRGDSETNDQ